MANAPPGQQGGRLQGEERGEAQAGVRLDRTLAALNKQTAKVRESGLRLEFQGPIDAALTRVTVAVETDALSCGAGKQRWQNYVTDQLIPFVSKHPGLRAALRHDDPDYHATLLTEFSVSC